jgi:hypothetical protein
VVADLTTGQSDSVPKALRPGGRKRVVEATPSREEAVLLGCTQQESTDNSVALVMVTTGPMPAVLVGSPLPTPVPTPWSSPD